MIGIQVGTYGGYVEFLDAREANKSEQNRIEWTTQLAAISRGKDKSANPTKRYASLMKEAEGGNPSRPFEFLPVVFSKNKNEDSLKIVTGDKQALEIIRYGHLAILNSMRQPHYIQT
jgi:hypothetical protein